MRKNIPLLGFIYGALMPWIGIVLFYWIKMSDRSVNDFLKSLFLDGTMAAKIFSLVLLMNLIPFYVFLNRKWYNATKGILIATFLYALFIIWLKYIK